MLCSTVPDTSPRKDNLADGPKCVSLDLWPHQVYVIRPHCARQGMQAILQSNVNKLIRLSPQKTVDAFNLTTKQKTEMGEL